MSSGIARKFTDLMHQEPVVMWSCMIGALGLALPLIVPPIRESFETKPTLPLQPMKVAKALSGQK